MTQKELLQLCRYYKGEDRSKNPYPHMSNGAIFWDLESQYVHNSLQDDAFRTGYEKEAQDYMNTHKDVSNNLTDPNIAVGTKAIILFISDMLDKWSPDRAHIIFSY